MKLRQNLTKKTDIDKDINDGKLYDDENLKIKRNIFSNIYVEEAAFDYPITRMVLQEHAHSAIIPVRHYKDVFNRTNQHFGLQKQYPSLILAVKSDPLLYKAPDICQNFGYSIFYYTSFLLNCIFDCEYCYLQGMYPSANLVAFVNTKDFKNAMSEIVFNEKEPIYLAVSYDTDLIAFHSIIPYLDYYYDFFSKQPDLFVEIRTKSASQTFYKEYTPLENIIIAFTLTPEDVIKKYEKYTPSLKARIKAVKTAIDNGFKVRLCFDPIFINPEMDELYEEFYEYIFSEIDANKILDVGYGFFRMSVDFFKRIKKQKNNSQLFLEDYCLINDVVSYPPKLQEKVKEKHFTILSKYIQKERLFSL
jgi:spore photoproduct lyase